MGSHKHGASGRSGPPALVKRFVEWLVRQEEERPARRRRGVLAHGSVREALEREGRR